MCIIDMEIKIDLNDNISDITYFRNSNEWLSTINLNRYLHKKSEILFGSEIDPTIIEINNLFFRCQVIEEASGKRVLLSSESVMKNLYEETLNKVSEGIQIFNRNGYFMYGNPASEKLEGYKKEDFQNKHLLDLYNLSEEYSTTLSVLRTKKPILNRCDRFIGKDMKELVTINSGYPLIINEKIYGASTFESDLSVINNIKNRSFNLEAFIRTDQSIIENTMYSFKDIIHVSESMAENIVFAKKIALTNTNILITGETGTGKELFAQSIHAYSPRRDKPFIDVNCSAIPSNLIESLFFGTEKGAFTGSLNKKGFFEVAEGGSLFLDEINSMGLDMQVKLLRVLQEKRFQRVGGNRYIQCDIRIIAASNEDLLHLIQNNLIRKDFYYRISTLSVNIPPLRDRKEDIPVLAKHFLKVLSETYGQNTSSISEEVYRRFSQYEWPGNIRELRHVIEYAINHAAVDSEFLTYDNMPAYLKKEEDVSHKNIKKVNSEGVDQENNETLEIMMETFEKKLIINFLNENKGNVTKTAKLLGVSRQSLQYRIKKYEINGLT